jgi:hypothetical protein
VINFYLMAKFVPGKEQVACIHVPTFRSFDSDSSKSFGVRGPSAGACGPLISGNVTLVHSFFFVGWVMDPSKLGTGDRAFPYGLQEVPAAVFLDLLNRTGERATKSTSAPGECDITEHPAARQMQVFPSATSNITSERSSW